MILCDKMKQFSDHAQPSPQLCLLLDRLHPIRMFDMLMKVLLALTDSKEVDAMQISVTVDFTFSGCDYHPPPPPDFDTALSIMRAGGLDPQLDYEVWAYRDLLLALSQQVARQWPRLEREIRDDVTARLGYENGVAPRQDGVSPDANLLRARTGHLTACDR